VKILRMLSRVAWYEGWAVGVEGLRELLERERVPYPDRERLFLVLGLLLTGRISMG